MKKILVVLLGLTALAWTSGDTTQVDLVSLGMGGHVESPTSSGGTAVPDWLIDGNPRTYWIGQTPAGYPIEIVFSFFGRQPALIQSVTLQPGPYASSRPKDVEVWTSNESATAGFTKAAAFTVAREGAQSFPVPPVEARFVKLSIRSNYGDQRSVTIGKVNVIEGTRPGYQSMLARHPDLAALVGARVPDSWAAPSRSAPAPAAFTSSIESCRASSDAAPGATERPRQPESRNVLLVTADDSMYPAIRYRAMAASPRRDPNATEPLYTRVKLRRIRPTDARPAMLADVEGFDTVVLSQVCDVQTSVPAAFRQALAAWVSAGHKLIIHDSDACGGKRAVLPDYAFLPYPFATRNPGAMGARSATLALVEESALAHSNRSNAAYVDVEGWKKGGNELGDSNSISQWDAHWCGVLVGTNALGVNGFQEAYAHHGRGLIIYDGFDKDQLNLKAYRQIVTRELAVPFDPDPLPCSVRLSSFVIATEPHLRVQPMGPGRTYTYPLTLLSNQGYKGRVKLSLAPSPGDPAVTAAFQPDTIDLSDKAASTLTVATTAAAKRGEHVLAVRGTDAAGKAAVLCLNLAERRTGGLKIATAFGASKKAGRNLEIVLDESGSMKLPLGTSTRIATARKVLATMLAKLPDDFNVGLRVYGHRFASNQKQTCTDSQIVVPLQRLNRARLLSIVDGVKPRGETPLVYSVLQTIPDLTAAGGGSIVLITEGEESCHGDPVAAAAALRGSGLDVTLNIVGFTLKAGRSQEALSTLAAATGGRYYSAQNGDALGRALLAAAIRELPYRVLDAGGKQVAAGVAGGESLELPPGQYKVIVTAADEELIADKLAIGMGSDTTLTVALEKGHFVIVRQ